jgi:beta-1,4-mannosyl-glycoprotein beta-1,4-N-acetylglucosaminyltransferase
MSINIIILNLNIFMKIFDCFMYFDEDIVLEVRLNFLNEFVDEFIIVESEYNHKGEKRIPLFDINKFEKFKHKIKYILISDIPPGIDEINSKDNNPLIYHKSIFNAWKRENFQRNQIIKGLVKADKEDWVIISDLDEIPNLREINLKNVSGGFVFFKQEMMYYKFNLKLENYTWVGSKACKMKNLESPQWIRDIKDKKYQWWRIDAYFSKKKYHNIRFIENGGWHFSYLKNAKGIEKKLRSYLHHIDYDLNPVGEKGIEEMIKNKRTIYNIKVDQKKNKFDGSNKLNKIDMRLLPSYILENKKKFSEWIED